MTTIEGRPHETYIVPGIVDGRVAIAQAEKRRDKHGEPTIVHDHAYREDEKTIECNPRCKIFTEGHQTIAWLDFKAGAIPPKTTGES